MYDSLRSKLRIGDKYQGFTIWKVINVTLKSKAVLE